ncbi:DeoR/GlpR family DNA-binding transcription regulator [Labedella endophytica]|uniref:Lactose phosphotransferase system repressor n=1 Tax=Labedella endophytica TaxID=1523160 RepID=A0A433JVH0_9MICO|nr:DeoR/GlpR family DNA-binding transcription regulator [Labedella endophytica]RUR03172.1 DeoR/GlpR transcriptional regulator [Labedella endophytica]
MYATERHQQILSSIEADGRVSVTELSRRFDVTSETIRRDLDQLESLGHVRRVHGGAVSASRASVEEPTLADRENVNRDGKRRIAEAAMRLVPSDFRGSVLVDSGTTTGALAARLGAWTPSRPDRRLDVITNSVPIAAALYRAPALDLHLLGGRVRGETSAAVGAPTVEQLDRLRPDIAFIGANGVSADFGLSTPDELESAVKSAMVRSARRRILLADSGKLGEEALHRFAALGDLDVLITDAAPDARLSGTLESVGVEVVVA